jgi:hypothetical protein
MSTTKAEKRDGRADGRHPLKKSDQNWLAVYAASRERKKTHDDFGVDPGGLVKIFTFIIATRPSEAFVVLELTE